MTESAIALNVRDMHARFESLFNSGDIEGLLDLYEPYAILHPSPGQAVTGKEAIRTALSGFIGLGGKITVTTLTVFERGDGIALTHGEWSLKGGSTELAGKTAEVLRCQPDGRWLYIIDNPWV